MFFIKYTFRKRKGGHLEKAILLLFLAALLLYIYHQDECVNYSTHLENDVGAPGIQANVQEKQRKNNTARIPIVVVVHARSGSSFVSEVLQKRTTVFYVFEPFHNIKLTIKNKRKMKYVNGTSRYFQPKDFSRLATDILKHILTCNVDYVPLNLWEGPYTTRSRTTIPIYSCMKTKAASCPSILKAPCQTSSHILVKTTRIPLSVVEQIMHEIPSLKVILLTRDPRAIINSWMKFDWIRKDNLIEDITKICNEMYDNAATYDRLQRHYPKRTLNAIYEDIAYHPQKAFSKIFAFLKMEFTTTTRDFIASITFNSKTKKCGSFCTIRNNSTKEAERWRNEIKLDVVKKIDTTCGQLYRKVGYHKIYNEKMLRDHNYKLRYTPNVSDFHYG